MSKLVVTIVTVLASSPAFAEARPDKGEVLKQIAVRISNKVQETFIDNPVKPKLWIAEISNTALTLSASEAEIVSDNLDVELSKHVVLLDRDKTQFVVKEEVLQASGSTEQAAQLGQKIGASHLLAVAFRDQSAPTDNEESEVTITAKLTVIELKTQRKVLTALETVRYRHQQSQKTGFLRNTASLALGAISISGVVGAAYYGNQASLSKKKYDDATNSDDAKRFRQDTDSNKRIAYGAGGVALLSLAAKLVLDHAIPDAAIYHEYELVFQPHYTNGMLVGFVCNQ